MRIVQFDLYSSICTVKHFGQRRSLIICLTDETGKRALGEIAPLSQRSVESYDEALESILEVRRRMLQSDFTPLPLPPSVVFGLGSALLDLSTSSNSDEFEICHLAFTTTPVDPTLKQVKIKTSESLEESEACVRRWINNGSCVRVDISNSWDFDRAVEFANKFSQSDILYLEDPVSINKLDAFKSESDIPIAVDSPLRSNPIEAILEKEVSFVVIKPSIVGGLEACKSIVEAAKRKGVTPIFSSSYETLVGLAHIVRMGKTLNISMPFGVDTLKLFERELTLDEKKFASGLLQPFDVEGLINYELLPNS